MKKSLPLGSDFVLGDEVAKDVLVGPTVFKGVGTDPIPGLVGKILLHVSKRATLKNPPESEPNDDIGKNCQKEVDMKYSEQYI